MTLEEAIQEMRAETRTPLTLETAAAYIRQAYGIGYTDGLEADLEADGPDRDLAREHEREAWARLPI